MNTALQVSSNAVASRIDEAAASDLFRQLVINSDLAAMTPDQQIEYYKLVCSRVGLDPYQKPFDLIKLSGKLTLYANKTATAQLTSLRNLKVSIVAREVIGDQYVVTARCETPSGGYSEDIGAVPIGGLRGDAASNAMKKASTQAKRRAILAACGLGMLDEEEVMQVRDAVRVPLPDLDTPRVAAVPVETIPIVSEPVTDDDESLIADMIATIDGATSGIELDQIVAYLKQTSPRVRDEVKGVLQKRAKQLGLVWIGGRYQEQTHGNK